MAAKKVIIGKKVGKRKQFTSDSLRVPDLPISTMGSMVSLIKKLRRSP